MIRNIQYSQSATHITHLMMTMMPSKMLYGFLKYSKKPKAVSFRIISSVNMLVKTMLQISRTLVSSSGLVETSKQNQKSEDTDRYLFCFTINLKIAGPNIGVTDFSCYLRAITKNVPLISYPKFQLWNTTRCAQAPVPCQWKKGQSDKTNDEKGSGYRSSSTASI